MLTIAPATKSRRFIEYIEPMIHYGMPYYVWPGGGVPDGQGAYAYNGPAPAHSYLRGKSIFCAAVATLALRLDGKRVPIAQRQSPQYDGGVAAYFGSPTLPQIGAGYFTGYTQRFDYNRALSWARETRQIVLLGRKYTGVQLANHGHVALLLPSGYVLQSNYGDGLNWNYTLAQSHAGYYYTEMAHPSMWLEYDGDYVHQGGIWGQ